MCNFFYPQKTPQLNKNFIFHLFEVPLHDVCFYVGGILSSKRGVKINFNLSKNNNLIIC